MAPRRSSSRSDFPALMEALPSWSRSEEPKRHPAGRMEPAAALAAIPRGIDGAQVRAAGNRGPGACSSCRSPAAARQGPQRGRRTGDGMPASRRPSTALASVIIARMANNTDRSRSQLREGAATPARVGRIASSATWLPSRLTRRHYHAPLLRNRLTAPCRVPDLPATSSACDGPASHCETIRAQLDRPVSRRTDCTVASGNVFAITPRLI